MNFVKSVNEALFPFISCYELKTAITEKHLNLNNRDITIDIYLDDYFAVNTYFNFFIDGEKQAFNLISFSKYLNLDENARLLIVSNQVSDNGYLINYLECVAVTLAKVINMLNEDKASLCKLIERYKSDIIILRREEKIRVIISQLNIFWQNKRYTDYFECFNKNEMLIKNDRYYSLARRRATYIEDSILQD